MTRMTRPVANANVETTTGRDVAEVRTIVEAPVAVVTAPTTEDVADTPMLATELLIRKMELWKANSPVKSVNPVNSVNLVNLVHPANPVKIPTTPRVSRLPSMVISRSATSKEGTEASAVVVQAKSVIAPTVPIAKSKSLTK